MNFKVGDEIQVLPAVYWQGYDLSRKRGIVSNVDSYILVYFHDLNITVKLFSYDIEHYVNIYDWF